VAPVFTTMRFIREDSSSLSFSLPDRFCVACTTVSRSSALRPHTHTHTPHTTHTHNTTSQRGDGAGVLCSQYLVTISAVEE
jgi:hypothetical protein